MERRRKGREERGRRHRWRGKEGRVNKGSEERGGSVIREERGEKRYEYEEIKEEEEKDVER